MELRHAPSAAYSLFKICVFLVCIIQSVIEESRILLLEAISLEIIELSAYVYL